MEYRRNLSLAALAAALVTANTAYADALQAAKIERGKYLTTISGCNDCHTAGYAANDGNIPISQWLKGDDFGWRGPWGTTYGSNLRLFAEGLSEQEWIQVIRTMRRRPPMPWFNLNAMSDEDLGALYAFVRSLGESGTPALAALPPNKEPSTPHALWVLPQPK